MNDEWCIVLCHYEDKPTRVIRGFKSSDACDYYCAEHEEEFCNYYSDYVKLELPNEEQE